MSKIIYFILLISISFQKTIFLFEHIRHSHCSPDFKKERTILDHKDIFCNEWKSSNLLTKIGKRSAFLQGYRTRLYYKDFLPEHYHQNEIFYFSSPAKRVIQGIHAQMMGLFYLKNFEYTVDLNKSYPPGNRIKQIDILMNKLGNDVLGRHVDILPYDIINDDELDYLFLRKNICPGINEIKNDNVKKNENVFNELYKNYISNFGNGLKEYFNKTSTDFLKDYDFINKMSNLYIIGYDNNRFNHELNTKYNIDLRQFYKLNKEFQFNSLFKRELNYQLSKIALSKTLPKILKWMENRVQIALSDKKTLHDEINGEPKYVLYAGHANTLGVFEVFMRYVFNTKLVYPEFTSHFFFDIYKYDNKDNVIKNYKVKYIFDDEILLEIDYLTFKKKIEENLMDEQQIHEYCKIKENKLNSFTLLIIIILFIVVSICVSMNLFKKINLKKSKKSNYLVEKTDELNDDE